MSFWHIYICASYQKWSFRRFTYGNLVTTSPSSRKFNLQILKKYTNLAGRQQFLQSTHQLIQSVGATGGVYKGQGRIQCTLMTYTYKVFLVYTVKLQSVIPYKEQV